MRPRHLVPVVLGLAAVAAQLVYPVVEGAERDRVTVVTVLLFSGASLSHAWVAHGWRFAARVLVVVAGGGLAVEALGVATGFPFGAYAYAERLGLRVGEVPVIIPLAWTMIGYPALVIARTITGSRTWGPVIGAVALTAWDLYLDPQMVAEGYWTWQGDGPHLIDTITATNYLAWLGTGWLMMLALWPAAGGFDRRLRTLGLPVALYAWTWIGSLVAHVVLLDLPQSALYGGVGMGAVLVALAVALWRGPAPETTDDDTPGHRESIAAGGRAAAR